MESAIINSSELARAKRLDAAYYVFREHYLPLVEGLRAHLGEEYGEEKAYKLLEAFPKSDLQALAPLSRRNSGKITMSDVRDRIADSPFLCLAVMLDHVPDLLIALDKAQADLDARRKMLNEASKLLDIKTGE